VAVLIAGEDDEMFMTRSLNRTTHLGARQGKNWQGGCGGWTPTGKQITPTANAREKS